MDLHKELRAMEALTKLMKTADECRSLFDEAGLEYPAPLKRALGLDDSNKRGRGRNSFIRPPDSPSRPSAVPATWIAVPAKEMTPTGIVLGVLAAAKAPVPVKQVISAVEKVFGRTVNPGSIHNIGTRLNESAVIERTDEGWKLADQSKGLAIHESHVWGPVAAFSKEEVAAWRRQAILHILSVVPGGLQQGQVVGHLEACDWLRLPANKDQVKMDMLELQKAKKVKRGRNNKWMLASGEGP